MVKKNQPPLWLDMDFAEALERFGKTDGKEAKAQEELTASKRREEDSHPPPVPPLDAKLKRNRGGKS